MTDMIDAEAALEEVRLMLRSEPRVDFDHQSIQLAFANGELLIFGEVANMAAKRLAVERAARAPSVTTVHDELCVRSTERVPDAEVRDLTCKALVAEPTLAECSIRVRTRGGYRMVRVASPGMSGIDITVNRGVVTLDGAVSSLAQKRLAGVLSWWLPGSRNVINNLAVQPPEEDTATAIEDAMRLVLDKDSAVHAEGIRVRARGAVLTLAGTVPAETDRVAAERDAWCTDGVQDVVNNLEIHS